MYSGYTYILNMFKRLYRIPPEIAIGYGDEEATINIIPCETNYFEQLAPFDASNCVKKQWQDRELPFLFTTSDANPILTTDYNKVVIHYDILASAFFFISGWQESVYHSRVLAPRYSYVDSLQHKLQITDIPVVNYYFDILANAIRQQYKLPQAPSPWGNAPFSIFLSHDIDHCYSGWLQDGAHTLRNGNVLSALGIGLRAARGQHSWFNFKRIIDVEAARQAQSTFFFIGSKGKVFLDQAALDKADVKADLISFYSTNSGGEKKKLENADYNLSSAKMRSVCHFIREAGSEVAMHGGFTSHINPELFAREMQQFDKTISGHRFHYLYFEHNKTPALLDFANIGYDATLGFAETPGFRNGIVHPFYPWNAAKQQPHRFLEIPLTIMDTTFRSYTNTPKDDILPIVKRFYDEAARFNGCISVLWHNNYFSDFKYAGWQKVYEDILDEGQSRGAMLASGEQIMSRYKSYLTER
ncbi:MAG: DUF7033 domain-containing protein [Calditrichia bacterium]